jgi:hypothetical protein
MSLPNNLLLGVGKAGTTSIYHYARQHPQAAVSKIREPNFLTYAGHRVNPIRGKVPPFHVLSLRDYEDLYAGCEDRRARMDISPLYFVHPEQTIIGIRRYVPEAKMIAIFRQPADRGYSNFLMHVRMGDERLTSFPEALEAEKNGLPRARGQIRTYFDRGLYLARTKRFLAEFPRERFLFLLFDDLVSDPRGFLKRIFRFMEIDPDFSPDLSKRHNAGAWPRNMRLHRLATSEHPLKKGLVRLLPDGIRKSFERGIHARNLDAPPALDPDVRRRITRTYRDDILGLQELIRRDLSAWVADL